MRRVTGVALVAAAIVAASAGPVHAVEPYPAAVRPGGWTAPVWAPRSVPAYATTAGLHVRLRPGSGEPDTTYPVASRPGQRVLFGDWDGDGAATPALFRDGDWRISQGLVNARRWHRVSYGTRGDKPVVGDWDGDGRTDLGVLRGRTWYLALGSSAPARTWRRVRFGQPGAIPVAGDWDGDGVDGLASFRAGTWTLREGPRRWQRPWRVAFGSRGDAPLAGDWNGAGRDRISVVRDSLWMTRRHVRASTARISLRSVPAPAGGRPLAWSTLAGPQAAGCPTAGRDQSAPGGPVRPSRTLGRSLPLARTDTAELLRRTLRDSERFLLGTHFQQTWAGRSRAPYVPLLTGRPPYELDVRPPAMAALAVAVSLSTDVHTDATAGATRDQAGRYVDWLVRSVACAHRSVSPGGWGASWQSAHWAQLAGQAAWLVWDLLTPQTRHYVAAMVTSEADRLVRRPPRYWMDGDGVVTARGNSFAEEIAWDTALLELAVNTMPSAPQALLWRRTSVQYATAAYARPADLSSTVPVNGIPLRERLGGANAHDDGSVENHDIVHPDYASNIQQLWWAASMAGLAGRDVPEAMFHSARPVYEGLGTVAYRAGAASPAGGVFVEPGGTVYRLGSNDIYYPQGTTWGEARRAHWVSLDAHAWAWSGLQRLADWAPESALSWHLQGQRELMAARGSDGGTYSTDPALALSQDLYPAREEYAAQQLATGWLAVYVSRTSPPALDRTPVALPPAVVARPAVPAGREPDPLSP